MHTKRVPVSCFLAFHVHLWKACIFVVVERSVIFFILASRRWTRRENDFCVVVWKFGSIIFFKMEPLLKLLFRSSLSYKHTKQKTKQRWEKKETKNKHTKNKQKQKAKTNSTKTHSLVFQEFLWRWPPGIFQFQCFLFEQCLDRTTAARIWLKK